MPSDGFESWRTCESQSPPARISRTVLAAIGRDLRPSPLRAAAKLSVLFVLTLMALGAACPELLSMPAHTHGAIPFLHQLAGEELCGLLCGAAMAAVLVGLPLVLLRPAEMKVLTGNAPRRTGLLAVFVLLALGIGHHDVMAGAFLFRVLGVIAGAWAGLSAARMIRKGTALGIQP